MTFSSITLFMTSLFMWILYSAKTLGGIGTPENSWRGCAAPDPISDQKTSKALGGTRGNSWWGCAAYFRPKHFLSHTRFQPWPLSIIHAHSQTWPVRNYVIIT